MSHFRYSLIDSLGRKVDFWHPQNRSFSCLWAAKQESADSEIKREQKRLELNEDKTGKSGAKGEEEIKAVAN